MVPMLHTKILGFAKEAGSVTFEIEAPQSSSVLTSRPLDPYQEV